MKPGGEPCYFMRNPAWGNLFVPPGLQNDQNARRHCFLSSARLPSHYPPSDPWRKRVRLARRGSVPFSALASSETQRRWSKRLGGSSARSEPRKRYSSTATIQGLIRMLTEEEIAKTRASLSELQIEHRDLNLIIEHLSSTPLPTQDQLLIQRLKKRKLLLKDRIFHLEQKITPDMQA